MKQKKNRGNINIKPHCSPLLTAVLLSKQERMNPQKRGDV